MCVADIPTVDVKVKIEPNNNNSNKTDFKIDWIFHKEFIDTLGVYDQNKDGKFEGKELKDLKFSLVEYIKQFNYLTQIIYTKKEKKFYTKNQLQNRFIKDKFYFKNNKMIYSYTIQKDFKIKKDHKIYLSFYDKNGNFNFKLNDIIVLKYKNKKFYEPKIDNVIIRFYKKTPLENDTIINNKQEKQSLLLKPAQNKLQMINEDKNIDNSFIKILSAELEKIKQKLKYLLKQIKENNSLSAYFWLLGFSFLYGVIHAIGPGHGKTLVATYFLSQNRSYAKAFSIASLIGIVHTFSAFLLTLFIYNFIGFIFNDTLNSAEDLTSKISAVLIIIIAIYLIYQKLNKSKFSTTKIKFKPLSNKPNLLFITQHHQSIHTNTLSCSCNACKTNSSDLGVILAAGIVPCPGTVTVFIFTFGLGVYFIGFLSAVFMSIGMGFIIFTTALLGSKIREKSSSNHNLIKFLEYGSLFFILSLGVILLLV